MSDYLITTGDGLQHRLPALDAGAIALYSSSENTRAALVQAIADGDYTEAPPLAPMSVEANPSGFRAALASTASWLLWAEGISPVLYVNLATAAAQNNWTEAQSIYQTAAAANPPPPADVAAWQQLAGEHAIPITF